MEPGDLRERRMFYCLWRRDKEAAFETRSQQATKASRQGGKLTERERRKESLEVEEQRRGRFLWQDKSRTK